LAIATTLQQGFNATHCADLVRNASAPLEALAPFGRVCIATPHGSQRAGIARARARH